MGRRIYVDLNDQEEADIHGWVNLGRSDPTFANYPTKLVLAQRDRARFDQIATQFPASGGGTNPPPTTDAADPNYGVPAGTFSGVGVDTPLYREDDQARVRMIDPQLVLAVPLVIPPRPWNQTLLLNVAVAEYGSPPTIMQGCMSKLPGDFRNALGTSRSEGTSLMSLINVNIEHLNPDEVIYFNVRLWSSDLQRVTSETPHQVRLGGGWPR